MKTTIYLFIRFSMLLSLLLVVQSTGGEIELEEYDRDHGGKPVHEKKYFRDGEPILHVLIKDGHLVNSDVLVDSKRVLAMGTKDVYSLVSSIAVKDGTIIFKPRTSFKADVYNRRYKVPLSIYRADLDPV